MKYQNLSLFIFLVSFSSIFCQEYLIEKSPMRYTLGDSLQYIKSNYDDSQWEILYEPYLFAEDSIVTIRSKVYINIETLEKEEELTLLLNIIGNYKVYWNGLKLGQNFNGEFLLSDELGVFETRFNLSETKRIYEVNDLVIINKIVVGDEFYFETIKIFTKSQLLKSDIYAYGFMLFLIIIHVYFLYLFLVKFKTGDRYLRFLLVLISFLIIVSFFVEYFLFFGVFNYDISLINDYLFIILSYLLLLSITVFLNYLFFSKSSLLHILIVSIILLYISYFEFSIIPKLGLILGSSIITIYSSNRKNNLLLGSTILFLLFITSITFAWFDIQITDISFLILFYYLGMDYLVVQQRIESELAQTELKSSRLENEMLKKIIQPHYIMNSMNSVLDLIEDSPKKVVGFIKDLTEEFRIFLKFSDKKEITITEELELCKKHLSIMEYRQLRQFKLEYNIENPYKKIPPVLLHTLIENGVTHNSDSSNSVCFYISEKELNSRTEIIVKINYANNCNLNANNNDLTGYKKLNDNDIIEGTGIKYIKSRLSECFNNNWTLSFYTGENVWITKIEFS